MKVNFKHHIQTIPLTLCAAFFYSNFVFYAIGISSAISRSPTEKAIYDIIFIFLSAIIPMLALLSKDKSISYLKIIIMLVFFMHFQGAIHSTPFDIKGGFYFYKNVTMGDISASPALLSIFLSPLLISKLIEHYKKGILDV
ncbi:hypothetical protein D5R81_19945 [Parashewanella spongiae]|uniref:Uncharacterized protein n=1 Tax=Parashewanella spongiae TaxID=342950 RepID=A0A3A6TJT7_9GAMM|nr:hypothetical protein [Parashewanella spongiae]MCL1080324.1 hypothetical protein [Parashewanella spongiae]RJY01523.1 hypothetical protein D5R81_19945 [Parashewanella spongiae]